MPLRKAKPAILTLSLLLGSTTIAFPQPLPSERERALQVKDSFKECADCPEMVVAPAGEFLMSARKGDQGIRVGRTLQ